MTKLWAVARSSYLQAVRNRSTGIIIVVLLTLAVLLPSIAQSNASRLDTMRTFIVYAMGFGGLLISLTNIIVSCRMICDDIETHQIFTPLSKPVDRMTYLVGRWLGIVLQQATLLAVLGVAVLLTTQYMKAQLGVTEADDLLNRRFFTARVKYTPTDFDSRLEALVDAEVARRQSLGALGEDTPEQVRAETMFAIRREAYRELTTTGPGEMLQWRFENLPPPSADAADIQLYLKVNASNAFTHEFLNRMIGLHNPLTGEQIQRSVRIPVGGGEIYPVPTQIIRQGGALNLGIANTPLPNAVRRIRTSISVGPDDVYLLYRVGGFMDNFLRSLTLMLILQAFLSALAMLAGSGLSFPVAMLWGMTLYAIGAAKGFLMESTTTNYTDLSGSIVSFSHLLLKGLLWLLPNFARTSPVNRLVDGLVISWSDLMWTLGQFSLYAAIALVLGGLILKNRELARVIAR